MSLPSFFPLEIQELRRPSNVYKINVRWFTSIKDIKDQLHKDINCPISRMQIYHSSSSKALSNNTTLHDLGIFQAGSIIRVALMEQYTIKHILVPSKDLYLDERCDEMIRQVQLGLRCGHPPAKTDMLDCTGGVYFMKASAANSVAVFKPSDEEQGMPNNPKGYNGNGEHGLREFLKPGEGYIRETVSYILDKDNFCQVPATTIVHCEHDAFHYPRKHNGEKNIFPKLGSLQQFIRASDTFEDISPSMVSVLELQKIALLDLRLLNSDRNSSNILAIRKLPHESNRKYSRSSSLGTADSEELFDLQDVEMDLHTFLEDRSSHSSNLAVGSGKHTLSNDKYNDAYSLIPIDHGYCIPDRLHIDEFDWCWFYCPHIAEPVHPDIKDYMNSLDIDELLLDLSKQIPLSEDTLFLLRVTHRLIKEGIAQSLTLYDLACLIARTNEEMPSPLEIVIGAAEDNSQRAIEMRAGRRNNTGSPSFWKNVHDTSFAYNNFNNQHTNSSEKNAVTYDKTKFVSTGQYSFKKSMQALNIHSHDNNATDEIATTPRSIPSEHESFTHSPLRKSCVSESNLVKSTAEPVVRDVEELKSLSIHREEDAMYSLDHLSVLKESEEYLSQSHTSMESSHSPLSPSLNSYFQSDLLSDEEQQQETPHNNTAATTTTASDGGGLFLRLHDATTRYPRPGDALVTLQSYDAKLMRSKPSRTPSKFNASATYTTKLKTTDNALKDYSTHSFNTTITRSTTTTTEVTAESDDFTSSAASSLESIGAVRNDSFFLVSNNNNNNNKSIVNNNNRSLTSSPVDRNITHESDNGTDSELDNHNHRESTTKSTLTTTTTTTRSSKEDELEELQLLSYIPPPPSSFGFSSLSRVVSFGAFGSPPLYNLAVKSERQVARLKQEKRKLIAKTTEFQLLRLNFTNESITSMINKETRKKMK